MKLQSQVCSLEQAKRLKELGVSQESYFLIGLTGPIVEAWSVEGTEDTFYAAFTVGELGVMLLAYSPRGHSFCPLGSDWFHAWQNARYESQPIIGPEPNEARVRAAMLVYLLENNLIQVEDVNKRLK